MRRLTEPAAERRRPDAPEALALASVPVRGWLEPGPSHLGNRVEAPHRRGVTHERIQGRVLRRKSFVDLDQPETQPSADQGRAQTTSSSPRSRSTTCLSTVPTSTVTTHRRPRALKDALAASDAVLFITPEYNRSIPGALKNAIDWASRPWGQNSFDHMPAAVIGASIGQIGTAVAQQSLRGVLSFCNARQMTAPEAYVHFHPEMYTESGEVHRRGHREVPRRVHAGVPHSRRARPDRHPANLTRPQRCPRQRMLMGLIFEPLAESSNPCSMSTRAGLGQLSRRVTDRASHSSQPAR